MMLDGLSPTQDPVLVPSLSKDPVGPWMEQALVHVFNDEFCDCMAGIENRRISASDHAGQTEARKGQSPPRE